jgi:hypothetical protein
VTHHADRFWTTHRDAANACGFVVFWTLATVVMMATHDGVPRAPAYVRAAGVPLGFAALALVVHHLAPDRLAPSLIAAAAVLTLVQIAHALDAAALVPIALACGLVGLLFLRRRSVSAATRQLVIALVIALVAGQLAAVYLSYPVRRVGPIPASAILAAFRVAAGSLMVAAVYAAAASARFADRLFDGAVGTLALIAALCVQLAFFHVDLWTNPIGRCVYLAIVLAVAVGVARWLTRGPQIAGRLYALTVVSVLGLAALQFVYFYRDYFGAAAAR